MAEWRDAEAELAELLAGLRDDPAAAAAALTAYDRRASAAARQRLTDLRRLELLLANEAIAARPAATAVLLTALRRRRRRRWSRPAAAVLLAAAGLLAVLWWAQPQAGRVTIDLARGETWQQQSEGVQASLVGPARVHHPGDLADGIELQRGRLQLRVDPAAAPTGWTARTPDARAVVRGTDFSLASDRQGSVLRVADGLVAWRDAAGEQLVGAGGAAFSPRAVAFDAWCDQLAELPNPDPRRLRADPSRRSLRLQDDGSWQPITGPSPPLPRILTATQPTLHLPITATGRQAIVRVICELAADAASPPTTSVALQGPVVQVELPLADPPLPSDSSLLLVQQRIADSHLGSWYVVAYSVGRERHRRLCLGRPTAITLGLRPEDERRELRLQVEVHSIR